MYTYNVYAFVIACVCLHDFFFVKIYVYYIIVLCVFECQVKHVCVSQRLSFY